jgi:CRP-like cAMP-binding protein
MSAQKSPKENRILGRLSPTAFARLSPNLKLVDLPLGMSLYEVGDTLENMYFPASGIVSLLNVMLDGASSEVAVVGYEGVVGIGLFMGGELATTRAVVQGAGIGYQLAGSHLKAEFDQHGEMQQLLLLYTQSLLRQMAQTVACNRHHTVDQQLCRWLLLSLDRMPTNVLIMTQVLMANMLGVRREGVTEAAGRLQKLGIISFQRGRITVLDRPRLEQHSCECYAAVRSGEAALDVLATQGQSGVTAGYSWA